MTVPGVRLAAVAGYLPSATRTNADLIAAGMDTTDEWIRTRTGIAKRHIAAPDESVVDLAAAAAEKALAAAGVSGSTVDLTILASATLSVPIPNGAGRLAARLGNHGAAFDLNAGCASSCYALAVGADAIRSGSARTVVVAGAERLTDWVDPDDRATAILFGDGAGAFVLLADDDEGRRDIGPVAWASDGDLAGTITLTEDDHVLQMQGQSVFRWATTQLAPLCRRACELAGVGVEELAAFVPHQANQRIIDGLARSLGIDETRTIISRQVVETGNTSSASVPLALSALLDDRSISPGAPVLLVAFGAGLSMAAQVVRCP